MGTFAYKKPNIQTAKQTKHSKSAKIYITEKENIYNSSKIKRAKTCLNI